MRIRLHRWGVLGLTAAGVAAVFAGVAVGQEGIGFERVEVSLWPEYDRPGVLVIRRLTLDPDVALPATVRMRIPVAAGIPNAVAEADPSGTLVVASYERTPRGEWAELRIEARYPRLQVEYYEPFERDGNRRSHRWVWPGDHPVAEMVIHVLEPVGTVDMQLAPPTPGGLPGPEGLTRHRLELGAVAAGEEQVVELQWVRDRDELSVGALQPDPAGASAPPGAASESTSDGAYRLLVGAGAAALAAVLVWFLLLRGARGVASRRPASGDQPTGAEKRDAEGPFCTRCGTPSHTGDRFCHSCGATLR